VLETTFNDRASEHILSRSLQHPLFMEWLVHSLWRMAAPALMARDKYARLLTI